MQGLEWLKERSISVEKLAITRKLNVVAKDLGVSLPKLAIAWCLKNPNVSSVILGASKPHQLEETLTSIAVLPLLTDNVMDEIETILGNKPIFPMF
jgi:aryl-alcohol dehydrogenase-like predicted oxidoreductase